MLRVVGLGKILVRPAYKNRIFFTTSKPLTLLREPQHTTKKRNGLFIIQTAIQKRFQMSLTQAYKSPAVWGLIGANVFVWAAWQGRANRRWMLDNFTLSRRNLRAGRIWTIVTCNFSHMTAWHLLSNCLGIFFFGSELCAFLGTRMFLSLFVGGGVAGCTLHLLYQNYQARKNSPLSHIDPPLLGASAGVMAIATTFAFVFPHASFLLYGIIPIPAWVLVATYFAQDVLGAVSQPYSRISHVGHVGGALAGVILYMTRIRPFRL